jgi:hypothetical protein
MLMSLDLNAIKRRFNKSQRVPQKRHSGNQCDCVNNLSTLPPVKDDGGKPVGTVTAYEFLAMPQSCSKRSLREPQQMADHK